MTKQATAARIAERQRLASMAEADYLATALRIRARIANLIR